MAAAVETSGGNAIGQNVESMDATQFSSLFEDCISRREYAQALKVCNQRLKAKPNDRYAVELRETVESFLDAASALELEAAGDDELAPPLEEMHAKADKACGIAFEAMFSYFTQADEGEDRLWQMGEQAVGIFWDVQQLAPTGSERRARLQEMSLVLLKCLLKRLNDMPRDGDEWLFEALGDIWWCCELEHPCERSLLEGCEQEWSRAKGSMETLVGYSLANLSQVPINELCDLVTQTWTLERTAVCNILETPLTPLEYGIAEVFAEVRRRPLIEPPLEGFESQFYVMTHVVYVLNCYNACLPNRKSDCPWVYAYIERCLAFWLREVQSTSNIPGATDLIDRRPDLSWQSGAVDAIAEAVDCLTGLGGAEEAAESDTVREAVVWLLSRQETDGFFYSPGVRRKQSTEYDHIHPTWTATAALQLDRRVPPEVVSPRCEQWASHARAAAVSVGFASTPPPRKPQQSEIFPNA